MENVLILASTLTDCVLVSAFASLVGIPIDIASSSVRLKMYVITAGVKKYESIVKKKRKKTW